MNHSRKIFSIKYHSRGADILFNTPHHDNAIEILQLWSDGGHIVAGSHILPIKSGSILIIDATQTHYSNPAFPDTYERSKIIVSKNFFGTICDICGLDSGSNGYFLKDGVAYFNYSSTDNAIRIIDHYYKTASEHYQNLSAPFAQAMIVSALISILTTVVPKLQEEEIQKPTNTMDLLAHYINSCGSNWQDISMEQICNNLHISPSRASHLFKELTGKSLTQYITLLRMTEAKRLLLYSSLKIKDISDILLFDDSTTFCRYFKKHVGCTPKEYKSSCGISMAPHNF